MSEHVPSVAVDIRFGHQVTHANAEAYVNRKTGDLHLIKLDGGQPERYKRGAWSLAVISYDGEVVHSLTPVTLAPDFTGVASELGWSADPHSWPTEMNKGLPRPFTFVKFGYHSDNREIACADYASEDGKTLRITAD